MSPNPRDNSGADHLVVENAVTTSSATTNEIVRNKDEDNIADQNAEGLTRWETIVIFLTNQIGLGALSLPHALQTLGVVPGIVAIVGLGVLTGYTGYVLLQFYKRNPTIANIADIGSKIGGRPLEIVIGVAFWANLCMCGASCLTTMSIALNNMSEHSMCTVGFLAIVAVASFLLCIPRRMRFIAKVGIPATILVLVAIAIVIASLKIHGPQKAPPQFTNNIVAFGKPTFTKGMIAILNICFAYAGSQSYITVMIEMRSPLQDFLPSLCCLQVFTVVVYSVIAGVIYGFAAPFTASPAIGSASYLFAKIAYGLVMPCVIGGAMVFGNTATKYAFVATMRLLKADREEVSNHGRGATARSWVVWLIHGFVFWFLAFILANSIPVFSSILSIVSAVFVAWFTFGIPGLAWLHLNKDRKLEGWRKFGLTVLNIVIIAIALFMNSGGMYAAIMELLGIFRDPNVALSGPFSCDDNGIFTA